MPISNLIIISDLNSTNFEKYTNITNRHMQETRRYLKALNLFLKEMDSDKITNRNRK